MHKNTVLHTKTARISSRYTGCFIVFIYQTQRDGFEPPITVLETAVIPLNERCMIIITQTIHTCQDLQELQLIQERKQKHKKENHYGTQKLVRQTLLRL